MVEFFFLAFCRFSNMFCCACWGALSLIIIIVFKIILFSLHLSCFLLMSRMSTSNYAIICYFLLFRKYTSARVTEVCRESPKEEGKEKSFTCWLRNVSQWSVNISVFIVCFGLLVATNQTNFWQSACGNVPSKA